MPGKVVFGLGGFGETNVALAGTCDIGAAPTRRVKITAGTGPITSFGSGTNRRRKCRAGVAFTLTYHATSLILPTAANIAVEVGDSWEADSDASGNWIVSNYQRNSGLPLASGFWRNVGRSSGEIDHTGTTDETVLATIALPILGANSVIRSSALWSCDVNTANIKTVATKLGGSIFGSNVLTSNLSIWQYVQIWNQNNPDVQVARRGAASNPFNAQNAAPASGTVDTDGAAKNITFTAELATSTEHIYLEAYTVDLLL